MIFCDEHADFILEVMRCLQLAIDPTATLAISETWNFFVSHFIDVHIDEMLFSSGFKLYVLFCDSTCDY